MKWYQYYRPPTWETNDRNVYFAIIKDDDICWYFGGVRKYCFILETFVWFVLYLCACICLFIDTLVWFCFFISCTHILIGFWGFFLFSTGYGECLLDEPVSRTYELPTLLPGQIYNANRQCELMFGPGSQICPYMVSWLPMVETKYTIHWLWISTLLTNRNQIIELCSSSGYMQSGSNFHITYSLA